jgi:hypothetical protein
VIDRITQSEWAIAKRENSATIEVRALLTDEQRIKMDAIQANAGERGAMLRQGQQRKRQSDSLRPNASKKTNER